MGRIGTIARRTFLIGSAAVAGGVAFGVYAVKTPHANPLMDDLADGETAFNPWVKVSAEQITLITPHADIGQGAVSLQAALIAEEMDLAWGQFETEYGVPSAAYYNTAFADEGVPFMSHDASAAAETMRAIMGGVVKLIGVQGTGGSTSVPDSYEKLRRAGAIARETLKAAAARKHGVAVGDLKTKDGAVILPNGEAVPYTDLAAVAATIDPVTDVALRDPSEWTLIGKNMPRLDILAKSTGTLPYGADLQVDGQVIATVKQSPRRGALKSFDASAAEKMPGVEKIVPLKDAVAVIATNTWYAFKAADAIEFDWAEAPYPAEQDDHWKAVAAAFSEETLDSEWRNDGDAGAALVAGTPIEREYRAPYVAHQPLEPLNAIARVTDEKVEIWTGHQMPRFLQAEVAKVTGHEADQVEFNNLYAGGSFGHRLEFDHIKRAAEIAMTMKGTPVKLVYSREEDFATDYPRQIAMSRGAGTVKDGKVETIDIAIAMPSVISSQMGRIGQGVPGPDSQIAAGAWNLPYGPENFRMRAYRAAELAPISSWRSVGASSNGFFADTLVDELIHEAGADPMEERIRLTTHENSRKVLEAVAEMSNWGAPMGEGQGRGVALVDSFGVPVAEVVEVTNTPDGIRIDKVFVAADVGKVIDPVNFDNHVKGAVVWGLGHAMNSEITYADGMAQQANYYDAEGMRMHQCPEIMVKGLELAEKIRGIGEPPVPPAAPALGNAIFAATGKRLREMPFNKFVDFV